MGRTEESQFLVEVAQQPDALRDLIEFYSREGGQLLERWAKSARKVGRVIFAGMGTSKFAPEIAMSALGHAGLCAMAVDAGELLYYPRPIGGMMVLVSQSGESFETRALSERMNDEPNLVAITNDERSALTHAAELVLPLRAGPESAISTKTYVNTMAVVFLMCQALKGSGEVLHALDRLKLLADKMPLCDRTRLAVAASLLSDSTYIHFISQGPAMVSAKQAALTFMEGAHLATAYFTGGAFRHGPLELVDESHRCVIFMSEGDALRSLESLAKKIAKEGSHFVVITDQDVKLQTPNCEVLKVPGQGEDLFPLSAATTQALLLEMVARRRGVFAGEFRHIKKVTRDEWF